jgi:hypothetical protein
LLLARCEAITQPTAKSLVTIAIGLGEGFEFAFHKAAHMIRRLYNEGSALSSIFIFAIHP